VALLAYAVIEPIKAPVGLGLGKFRQLIDEFRIVATAPVVPHRTAKADNRAGPCYRQAFPLHDTFRQFPAPARPQSFFSMMSLRIR